MDQGLSKKQQAARTAQKRRFAMGNKSIEKVVKVVTGPVGMSVVLCAVIIAGAALFPNSHRGGVRQMLGFGTEEAVVSPLADKTFGKVEYAVKKTPAGFTAKLAKGVVSAGKISTSIDTYEFGEGAEPTFPFPSDKLVKHVIVGKDNVYPEASAKNGFMENAKTFGTVSFETDKSPDGYIVRINHSFEAGKNVGMAQDVINFGSNAPDYPCAGGKVTQHREIIRPMAG